MARIATRVSCGVEAITCVHASRDAAMGARDNGRMRLAALALLASCGVGDPQLTVSLTATFNDVSGRGPSPLDPLANQPIDIAITLDDVGVVTDDTTTCQRTSVFVNKAGKSARGATAQLVQNAIFEKLLDWDVALQLCDDPAQSSIIMESSIDELNTLFGCTNVPAGAQVRGADGFPAITTFIASTCTATILDVVNNRDFTATGFTIAFDTGPAQVP